MIVAVCGGDAVGKATQTQIVAEKLDAVLFSFPDYSTTAGKAILSNLKKAWTAAEKTGDFDMPWAEEEKLNALVLQSLMLTNRMERMPEIKAAIRDGRHIVFDRFDASAMVYGSLDGLSIEWLETTNAQLPVRPDLYILLDAPVEVGFARRPERRDRYESDREFLEKVRVRYLELFAERQAMHAATGEGARWVTVDATQTIEEVAADVWKLVQAAMPDTSLEDAAVTERKNLAELETSFAEWRLHYVSASSEAMFENLDDWIKRLGDQRHEVEKAERAVIASRKS
jgi:dTMP kinase